jgi:hypothetical protein
MHIKIILKMKKLFIFVPLIIFILCNIQLQAQPFTVSYIQVLLKCRLITIYAPIYASLVEFLHRLRYVLADEIVKIQTSLRLNMANA